MNSISLCLLALLLCYAVSHIGSTSTSPVSQLLFLTAPPYLRFDTTAGAISSKDIPRAAAAVLGLHSVCGWNGVSVSTAFSNPRAVIVMAIDALGLNLFTEEDSLASFPITEAKTAAEALGNIMDATHFGAAVLSALKQDATVHSACARPDLAVKAQPSQSSQSRALAWDAEAKAMTNQQGSRIGLHDLPALVNAGVFGSGVTLAGSSIRVPLSNQQTYTFDLSQANQLAFFSELAAITTVVATAAAQKQTTSSPEAVSVAITTLRALVETKNINQEAVVSVLGSVVHHLVATARAAFEGDVVVMAVTIQADKYADDEVVVLRRSTAGLLGNGTPAGPMSPAWVQHCAVYNCYCYADAEGDHWVAPGMCSKKCNPDNLATCSECSYVPCDCNSPHVQPASSKCAYCQIGYKLYGNHCFVDGNFPVAFNIIFILGVFAVASLIAICYALGGMDLGRNSIIYRMTSQRAKTQ